MTDAETLMPCPFCGEEAEIERRGDRSKSTIYSCTMCGCRLETGEEWGHGAQWNTRTVTAPVVSRIKATAAKRWFNETFNNSECDDPEIQTIRTLLEAAAKETT